MWYKCIEKRHFLESLYFEIPRLTDVRIEEIGIYDQGNQVSLKFDMPCFADKVPSKWADSGYNTVFVHLDFFGIYKISLTSYTNKIQGDIEIIRDECGLITASITGAIELSFQAECALFQKVSAYIKDDKCASATEDKVEVAKSLFGILPNDASLEKAREKRLSKHERID